MFKTDPSTLTSGQVMSWSSSEEYIGDESSVQSMSKSQTASQSPDKTTDQCELLVKASKTNSASKAVEFFTLFQDILVDDETYIALGFGDDNEEIDDDGINPTDFNVLDENWSDLDDEVKEEIEEKCIDENDSMDQEDEDIDLDLSEMIQNDYGLSNNSLVHGK
eukprot:116395_1